MGTLVVGQYKKAVYLKINGVKVCLVWALMADPSDDIFATNPAVAEDEKDQEPVNNEYAF